VTAETTPLEVPHAGMGAYRLGLAAAVTAIIVAAAIIFPRMAAILFLVPLAVSIGALVATPGRRDVRLPVDGLLVSVLGFAGYALASTLWSAAPMASLSKPLFLIGGALGVAVLATVSRTADRDVLRAIATGIVAGVLVGGALLCVETLTGQAITRFFMNLFPGLREGQLKHLTIDAGTVVAVAENNINRRATVVAMLLIPVALLSVLGTGRWRAVGLAGVTSIGLTLLVFSGHQSTQAALALGAMAVAMASLSAMWTRRLLAAAWVASCLLIVPIVMLLHAAGLHKPDSSLFHSARHRVVIWTATAEEILKAPLLGIGADATAEKTAAEEKRRKGTNASAARDGIFEKSPARHAHNVFLQVWYELGAAGALALTAIGLAALSLIGRQPGRVQPFLLGQFAAISGMIAFSFSMWQLWFQGAIGLGIVALVLAAAQYLRAPGPAD
jgi:O-antigen ligase